MTDLGFRGEVADYYQRYRRGYPDEVIDALTAVFGLTGDDVVLDLGCGTGQLTLPLAARVRSVIGMDPEPDMLLAGRRAAADQGTTNVNWLIGADSDLPALGALLGAGSLGAVTIGQALHWMDRDTLFPMLSSLVRPGGGVAVVTNGTPLWLQETDWSRALRALLEHRRGQRLTRTCGSDEATRRAYHADLVTAGFQTETTEIDYSDVLSSDDIVGGVLSALPVDRLPVPADRPGFAEEIHRALEPHAPFVEEVTVTVLTGRRG
ncbi:SAM-dependent methyltransferase [Actinoalloteichus hoggarensis]|uniref:Ubiquinone/menaquinone biosynthesis methyltransferase n=1 Tax=Actinoalloteichus hoggarensis TaxID=1470176 RepID=A0A221W5K7_9PSEU|nr:class I SAM-dependent methyltransferase [Actinoalloteichus hoggarensis]ASO20981.1 ubiquinone/menaquinone biosynthesis methyltransferase [Actinoalloteichus hoggarensis]MBB5920912.1 SAM-dependent methyltransferase [Actinoalloteichus hoggarensis]